MNFKKGLAYVFFATGIGFLINLVTNFVLPRFLSIETYADIKLYQLYITYVGILHLGFSDGMYLRLGGKRIKELDKEELISEFKTFKIFQLIVDIIAVLISIVLNDKVLLLVALSILPVNVINYLRNLYQATGIYDLYSKFTTTNNVMLFVINMVLLLIVKTDNAMAYIIGNFVVYILNWLLIEKVIKTKIFNNQKGKAKISYLIKDIKDGFLLMLGNFGSVIFTSIDRMFSKYMLGTVKFAFYSFAVSVEGLLNLFITPISVTMYNYLCNNNTREKVHKIKNVLLIITSIILTSAFPVKWVINNFITKYQEASNIIFILFAAQFFSIIARCIYTNLYKAEKRQNRYFFIIIGITILSAIFDAIALFINKSNEALAIATLIISFIWFVIGEYDFKKSKYKFKEYIFIAIVACTYLFAGLVFENAIIGCLIYVIVTAICLAIFMKKETIYLINEGMSIVKRKLKSNKKD